MTKSKWNFHGARPKGTNWVRMNALLAQIQKQFPQVTAEELLHRFQFVESFRTSEKAGDICLNLDVDPKGKTLARDPMKGCVTEQWANDVLTLLECRIFSVSEEHWSQADSSVDKPPAGTIWSYCAPGVSRYALVGRHEDGSVTNFDEGTATANALKLPGGK